MSSFGENLKELRKSRGYSQDKFARAINSNQTNVSAWELGTRTPTLSTIKGIADIFHVPVSSLISLENSGMEEDLDREILDAIKTNPKLRELLDRARYLQDDDISAVIHMVSAMTRDRT